MRCKYYETADCLNCKYHICRLDQKYDNAEYCRSYYQAHKDAAKKRVKQHRLNELLNKYGFDMSEYLGVTGKKVYISGKITGLQKADYSKKFADAEKMLKRLGCETVNPAKTNGTLPESTSYQEYMEMSLLMLSMCDAIYMLDNWTDSPGAKTEYQTATKNGLFVLYQKGDS